MSPEDVVVDATERLFNRKELSVVDESFGPIYVQHSALGADGVEGLKALVSGLPATTSYDLVHVIAEGEMVVTEGLFHGFAPISLTGFDVWRVVEGRVVEHWDALGASATHPAESSIDGEGDADPAAAKALVTDWVQSALVGMATEDAIGLHSDARYTTLHTVIAQGDLVYTRSEGITDVPVIINDVWRIADGRIVDRWGLVAPVPQNMPHTNGAF